MNLVQVSIVVAVSMCRAQDIPPDAEFISASEATQATAQLELPGTDAVGIFGLSENSFIVDKRVSTGSLAYAVYYRDGKIVETRPFSDLFCSIGVNKSGKLLVAQGELRYHEEGTGFWVRAPNNRALLADGDWFLNSQGYRCVVSELEDPKSIIDASEADLICLDPSENAVHFVKQKDQHLYFTSVGITGGLKKSIDLGSGYSLIRLADLIKVEPSKFVCLLTSKTKVDGVPVVGPKTTDGKHIYLCLISATEKKLTALAEYGGRFYGGGHIPNPYFQRHLIAAAGKRRIRCLCGDDIWTVTW